MARVCKDCEYIRHQPARWSYPKCHLNPPTISKNEFDVFPNIDEQDFCSKWEPKWDDNPVIAEAWELFQTTLKLAK